MAMQNLDINQFTQRSAVNLLDRLLLVTTEGNDGCITVNLIMTQIKNEITPSIDDSGMWLIGTVETGVQAIGKTPQLKQDSLGILWKYDTDTEWKLLVPWADIKFTFDELTEDQKKELIPTLDDFTEEEIAVLQQPAKEMIEQLQATDDAVKEAEALRVEAENARVEAETARADAETLRIEAETARAEAETARADAEALRVEAETARAEAETARATAETARATAETTRESNESTRIANENERIAAEKVRESNESTRITNENARIAAEEARASAESDRADAEAARAAAEKVRVSNENTRIENENTRITTDNNRKDDYATLREDIVNATKEAWAASAEVRNIPIIKDGTWWTWDVDNDEYKDTGSPATSRSPKIENETWCVWDDANEVYVDTGQSVNSTYQLTKEKIEGVFTGDIESHTHSRYVDKEDGKALSTEDFTTAFKTKLEGLENYDDTEVRDLIKDTQDAIPTKVSQLENDGVYATTTQLSDGLNTKQDLNLYFTDVPATGWVTDDTYSGFKYRCDLACEGVTAAMYAEVVFGLEDSSSGDYAPICETGDGIVSVWSYTNKETVVPTIVVSK